MKNWFLVLFFLLIAAWSEASESLNENTVSVTSEESPKDTYLSEYFGYVKLNTSQYRAWTITNTGPGDLNVQKITIRGSMFHAETNCPVLMKPQQKCRLEARFYPIYEGYFTGQLDMVFAEGGNIYIDLSGMGER